jgi:hypothetical protein
VDIVYLDQNKWIELARVHAGILTSGPLADLFQELTVAVQAEKVLFPLSASHVLETSKQNDLVKRGHLAETQAKLSRGYAFRSRAGRLEVEVRTALHRLFGLNPPTLHQHWAVVPSFVQAFEPTDSLIAPDLEVKRFARINASIDPACQYVDYMKNQDETMRRAAHVKLAANTADLVSRIEVRRARLAGRSVDMRRRAYGVVLFMEHQDLFLRILNDLGFSFDQFQALGAHAVRSLIEDVPTLDVEARMAARLESQTGAIDPNDVFDIQAFCTAIPYCSCVVAEKGSISRAWQAKLGTAYQVKLSKSVEDLLHAYPL